MAKNIYDGKMSGKRDRARPRLTFENTISKIVEKSHVRSMRSAGGVYEEIDDSETR